MQNRDQDRNNQGDSGYGHNQGSSSYESSGYSSYGSSGYGSGYGNQGYGTSTYGRERGQDWGDMRGYQSSSHGGHGNEHDGSREPGFMERMGIGVRRIFARGPKGFTRSDERIKEDLSERLMQQPNIDASDIEIDVTNCEVTLKGTVESRQLKYQVEEIAENIMGVKDVNNQLRISRGSEFSGRSDDEASSTNAGVKNVR